MPRAKGKAMNGQDEQTARILENLALYNAYPEEYTFRDWEELFEDRDPFEFI
jgi:hypothetical protein